MTVPIKAITTAAGRTAVGRVRDRNEDALLVGYRTFAVADGMGGHRGGDGAASMAIASVAALDKIAADGPAAARRQLCDTVQTAHRRVAAADDQVDCQGVGTTLTIARVAGPQLLVAHVGDSRAYLWHDGRLRQLTDDHTQVRELADRGLVDESQAEEHARQPQLTRSVGGPQAPRVDLIETQAVPDDVLLLCTDGLTGPVDDATIAAVMGEEPDAATIADRLIRLALSASGPDNITVVVLHF